MGEIGYLSEAESGRFSSFGDKEKAMALYFYLSKSKIQRDTAIAISEKLREPRIKSGNDVGIVCRGYGMKKNEDTSGVKCGACSDIRATLDDYLLFVQEYPDGADDYYTMRQFLKHCISSRDAIEARNAFNEGDYETTIEISERIMKEAEPEDIEEYNEEYETDYNLCYAYCELAIQECEEDNFQKAKQYLDKADDIGYTYPCKKAWGFYYLCIGDNKNAVNAYEEFLDEDFDIDPDDVWMMECIGDAYYNTGDYKNAVIWYSNACRNGIDCSEELKNAQIKLSQGPARNNVSSFVPVQNNFPPRSTPSYSYQPQQQENEDKAEEYAEKGSQYYDEKNYPKAIEMFLKSIELGCPEYVYNNCGNAYFFLKDYSNAIKYYQLSMKKKPDFKNVYKNIGNAYYHLGDYENAVRNYEIAQKNNIECSEMLEKARNKKREAESKAHAELLYNEGLLVKKTDPEKALELFQQAAKEGKALADVERALIYIDLNQMEKARFALNLAKLFIPEEHSIDIVNAEIKFNRKLSDIIAQAMKAIANNNYNAALKLLESVADVADEDLYITIARIYMQLEQYDMACSFFEKSINKYPSTAASIQGELKAAKGKLYLDEGNTKADLGNFEEAIENYKKAVEYGCMTYYKQGVIYHNKLNDNKSAISCLEMAIKNNDEPTQAYKLLFIIHFKMNELDICMKYLEKLKGQLTEKEYNGLLGCYYTKKCYNIFSANELDTQKLKEALEYGKKGAECSFPDAYRLCASIYSVLNEHENAIKYYQLALENGVDCSEELEATKKAFEEAKKKQGISDYDALNNEQSEPTDNDSQWPDWSEFENEAKQEENMNNENDDNIWHTWDDEEETDTWSSCADYPTIESELLTYFYKFTDDELSDEQVNEKFDKVRQLFKQASECDEFGQITALELLEAADKEVVIESEYYEKLYIKPKEPVQAVLMVNMLLKKAEYHNAMFDTDSAIKSLLSALIFVPENQKEMYYHINHMIFDQMLANDHIAEIFDDFYDIAFNKDNVVGTNGKKLKKACTDFYQGLVGGDMSGKEYFEQGMKIIRDNCQYPYHADLIEKYIPDQPIPLGKLVKLNFDLAISKGCKKGYLGHVLYALYTSYDDADELYTSMMNELSENEQIRYNIAIMDYISQIMSEYVKRKPYDLFPKHEIIIRALDYCIEHDAEPYCGDNGRLLKGRILELEYPAYSYQGNTFTQMHEMIDTIIECYEGVSPDCKLLFPLHEDDTVEGALKQWKTTKEELTAESSSI